MVNSKLKQTAEEAEQAVELSCGLCLGQIHSNLPESQVDWEFPVHPEKTILKKPKKKIRR